MKTFKRIACSFMTVVMLAGLTACAPKAFGHKKFAEFCDKHDFEEYDDSYDYEKAFADIIINKAKDGHYIIATKSDAQDLYDVVFNRFNDYPDCDVEEASEFIYSSKDELTYAHLYTLEDEKEAGRVFRKIARKADDIWEKGEEKGYSYIISRKENASHKTVLTGIYLKGNTILYIRTIGEDFELTEEFCKHFNIISPAEAEE